MADRTETVILDFEIDEGDSIESINSLIAANKRLRQERNDLNLKTEEGKKKAAELNAQIDKNTEIVKSNSSALEKQKANIGNYTSATVKTNQILETMTGKLGAIHPALGQVGVGLQAGVKGLNGMSLAAKAFIATGIGAVIAALGLAFAALMKYFKGSEEGQNKLNKVIAIGSALFEQLLNVVEKVGEVIFDAVSDPQQALKDFGNLLKDQLINRFTGMLELIPAVGRAIGLLFQGKFSEAAQVAGDAVGKVTLGIEGATEKITTLIKNTGEAVATGIAYGQQIAALNAKIDKEERKLIEDRAKTNLEVSKLRQQAVELEGKERINAVKQAIALEESLSKREMELAKDRLALTELQVKANGDDKESLTDVAEARAALTQAEAQAYDNTLRFRKELEQLTKEQAKAEEERLADERARQRAESGGDATAKSPEVEAEFKRAADILSIRERLTDDIKKLNEKQTKDTADAAEKQIRINQIKEEQTLAASQAVANAVLGFLDEQSDAYKAIATAQTLISTYSAATKAYEAAFLPIPTVASPALGAAFAAAAVIQGLANVAKINGVEFAEGGWTGPGSKWQPAGIVHADEYVVPKHIVNNPAAQMHVSALEKMRLAPYADGGFVAGSISQPINQQMEIGNIIKNLGPFEVSAVEMTKVQKRVEIKQKISRR